jgi:uncharacterized OsmC-like protein
MIIQMIMRAVAHRASSPMEVVTVAFAACATMIYCLSLERLRGVMTSVFVKSEPPAKARGIRILLDEDTQPFDIRRVGMNVRTSIRIGRFGNASLI